MSDSISIALQKTNQRINDAAKAAARDIKQIHLVAVSKTFSSEAIRAAYIAGSRDFGENYVQELVSKSDELSDLNNINWHFIGPLQTNKTRQVAELADWVHTIDRLKIAQRLSNQRPENLLPINICLQVNVSGELSKSGVPPQDLTALAEAVIGLPKLSLRGLMCIPDPKAEPEILRQQFAMLSQLKNKLNASGFKLDVLSMGMSSDLELAIAEGATHVRVGSGIFGQRQYLS